MGGLRDVPEGEETLALRRDLLAAAATTIRTGGRPEDALWTLWAGTDWPATLGQWARELGFSALGIARPDLSRAEPQLRRWLELGPKAVLGKMVAPCLADRAQADQLTVELVNNAESAAALAG